MRRRKFLHYFAASSVLLAGTSVAGFRFWPDEGFWNPCLNARLPDNLAKHELMSQAWDGIDPTAFRDVHTHLIGTGDSDKGIWLNPNMRSIWHPIQNIQFKFYLNGSCTVEGKEVDVNYVKRLYQLMQDFPTGAKAMLLAFEHHYTQAGKINLDKSPLYTPNEYAASVSKQHSDRFQWIASIHPYREDAIDELKKAVSNGAKAIKWLPPAMNINPASEKCDAFYDEMLKLNIPLLTHAGDEHAVDAGELQKLGNPLLLRRPLERGVKVIVAHCATIGSNADIDISGNGSEVENYKLFDRLMNDKNYEENLFGDISAITQINRSQEALEHIITHDEWHHRLVYGSDYPLPGVMPVFSPRTMVDRGYFSGHVADYISHVRLYNPLLFDFLLKRFINVQGKRLANSVFEAAKIIESR